MWQFGGTLEEIYTNSIQTKDVLIYLISSVLGLCENIWVYNVLNDENVLNFPIIFILGKGTVGSWNFHPYIGLRVVKVF